MKIRFRREFPAYKQGQVYDLPEETAAHYLNAGVAELYTETSTVDKPAEKPAPTVEPVEVEADEQSESDDTGGKSEPEPKPKRGKK